MERISNFRGNYYFLSNFYPARVEYEGLTYGSNEAAFQAQKTLDMEDRRRFTVLDPYEAKRKGRRVTLRKDWEKAKEPIMRRIVFAKFSQNPELKEKLLATGDAYLEEGNDWGDRTWGTVNGIGENLLGKILMDVRDTLAGKTDSIPDKEGTLVVLERSNGWYGGYLVRDGQYECVFNTNADCLFMSIRNYTDNGFPRILHCVPKEMEAEFMKNRTTLEQVLETGDHTIIWRYDTAGPFQMGGPRRQAIATRVRISDYKTTELEMGFAALVVEKGPAAGVYELTSGGLVGDTVEDVNADIATCGDRKVMEGQIKQAAAERDKAMMVSNERFGLERSEK